MIGLGGWGGRSGKERPVRLLPGRPAGARSVARPGRLARTAASLSNRRARDRSSDHAGGLPETFMHSADELYNQLRGPAKNMTVLATAHSPEQQRGTGRDEPQLMTIDTVTGASSTSPTGTPASSSRAWPLSSPSSGEPNGPPRARSASRCRRLSGTGRARSSVNDGGFARGAGADEKELPSGPSEGTTQKQLRRLNRAFREGEAPAEPRSVDRFAAQQELRPPKIAELILA